MSSDARPLVVTHVCPYCRGPFEAPVHLAATYCPECFDEAYGVTRRPAGLWHTSLLPGIICLCGALIVALWLFVR